MYVDLGYLPRGAVVEFHLSGNAANVWLMNSSTYSRYKRDSRVRAQGGHTRETPVRMQTPSSGHWYAVADLGGYAGKLGLRANVLPGPAAPIRAAPNLPPNSPLITFADELPDDEPETREFDVFVSHATEDKNSVVRPLAHALEERGVNVWYDEFELRVGDSLRRKIDAGIARSRFGLVVLSPAFFAKNWPQYELDGLVALDMSDGGRRLLPIWHEITKDEIIRHSPSLVDRVALSTSTLTVAEISGQIAEVVNAGKSTS
jgi:hypothetical protein